MDKINFRKKYNTLYSSASEHVRELTVPKMKFLMVDGQGTIESLEKSPEFQHAISALYGAAYTIKMTRKRVGIEPDYTIPPLEGLWWMVDNSEFDINRPVDWRWTLMIAQPAFILQSDLDNALDKLKLKQPNPALHRIRLEEFEEGDSVQIMHLGPYAEEARSVSKLDAYIKQHNYVYNGKHHEIYLGDPRRSRPETLKTILRHPVQAAR